MTIRLSFLLSLCLLKISVFTAQTPAQIEFLKTFARISGYVRYFHPSDEASKIEWNNFNIHAAERILSCHGQTEFEIVLNSLFNPIAPSMDIVRNHIPYSYDRTRLEPNRKKIKWTNWQHLGLGSDMSNYFNLYQSGRTNKVEAMILDKEKYFAYTQNIQIGAYIGKRIKFEAMVRLKGDKEGEAELWTNIADNSQNSLTQNDVYSEPVRSGNWATYSVETVVNDNAEYMTFGILVRGGVVYMDNVSLSYFDGKNWQNIPVFDAGFDSEEKLQKQEPDYRNWFYNKTKGVKVKRVQLEQNSSNKCLAIDCSSNLLYLKGTPFIYNPVANGEVIKKTVGCGLDIYMPVSLPLIKGETFPKGDAVPFEYLKNSCINHAKGLPMYLGNVITTWNVMQHFFPYFDVVETDWEADLQKAITSSFNDRSDLDHKATLERLLAPLKDAHISVLSPNFRYEDLYKPAIDWTFIEGKLVITKVCDSTLNVKKGQVVNRVNGISSNEFVDSFRQITSASNEGWLTKEFKMYSLTGAKGTSLKLEINGQTIELTRNSMLFDQNDDVNCACTPEIMKNKYKSLDSGILYLNLTSMNDEDLKWVMPRILNAKGLICDLRGYPGVGVKFIQQLMSSKESDKWMFLPEVHYPDFDRVVYKELGWNLNPEKPHISAKVVFITGPGAVSYGESYLGYIQGLKLAQLVGIPSAGTNGNVNMFYLPGGFKIVFTGMKVLKHDGTTLHTIGFIPEYSIVETLEDILNGEDVQLNKALEVVKKRD